MSHPELELKPELHQWFTPRWVCEAIVERHFADLNLGDTVIEPSCGDGRFLLALPEHVPAIGVELDPAVAARARANTGRQVICGDFRTVDIPGQATAIVGNPPFDARIIAGFLDRAHELLIEGGRCGLLLPAYVLQTSSKVVAMNERWSISQELMPRNIFPRLHLPLVFTMFRKDPARTLVGFFLYREAADVTALPKPVREAMAHTRNTGSVWRDAVLAAFRAMGRHEASLGDIYAAVEAKRPTENRFFREKVRQVLQVYADFRRVRPGVWALRAAA